MHEANKVMKRPYLYFLVEEGFRKNTATDRLREYLAVKFCERAEIEMRYIKLLQDWLDTLTPPRGRQDGAEAYMDMETVKRLTTSLRSEAQHTVDTRQSVYNSLVAEDGPYSRLQAMGSSSQKDKVSSSTVGQLKEIFAHLDAKRYSTEKEHRRTTDVREHLRHKIEELEGQLSQRSRLTSRRPPTRTGSRNVDDMRSRLSSLRQQKDDIQNKIDMLEHEMETTHKTAEKPLTSMDQDLQAMDLAKMTTLLQQTQSYLSHLRDLDKRKQHAEPLEVSTESLKGQWTEVQANARRLEVGEQFKLRELFAVGPQRPRSRMDGLITKPLASKAPASEIRSELASLQSRVFDTSSAASDDASVDRFPSPVPSSPGRFWPDSNRRTDSSCSLDDKSCHVTDIVTDHVSPYEGDRRPTPSRTWSFGSIEELTLPPEVVCPAELSRLEPNKQYKPKIRLTRPRHESPVTQFTEYIPVSRFSSEDYGDRSPDDDAEIAKQRDIRVVAKADNLMSPGSAELQFKKGQVIKQKAGANEDGYCYGWTREHGIGRKQYGYYRPAQVRLCRPGDHEV